MSNQAMIEQRAGREAAELRVLLLGSPRLEWQGRPLPIRRRQVRALLYYLAARLQPAQRTQLAFLFWPDRPEAETRRDLTGLLAHLRRALPRPDIVLASDDAVGLDATRAWSDAITFEQLCTTQAPERRDEALRQALDLYCGPFLDGFALPDHPEFETWMALTQNAYERLVLDALQTLMDSAMAAGDYATAIAYAERYLATDELAEDVHRRLIALYALTGDRNAALRQFERCAIILERELNVSPLPETRAVYEAALQGRTVNGEPSTVHRLPSNLPSQLTSFVGREREVAEVRRLLSAARLLTLTGAGGSGKTRLALEAAAVLVKQFADGVWWVELASLSDPELAPQAVASALGVREQPGHALTETLQDALHAKELLLVLDNCEHLVTACAHLADALLRACSRLRILATSREPLRSAGETAWPVPPLSLLEQTEDGRRRTEADPASVVRPPSSEAVRLFVERAQAALPSFALTEQNAAVAAQIVVRLDGMPLAIELAAARVKVLTVAQIVARLDDRFRLLTGGVRTALPRHQTLRAAMDWSYELLSEDEKALLRRLAVFAGGFALEAAEAVVSGQWSVVSGDQGLTTDHRLLTTDVLDLLSRLVDKSLVVMQSEAAQGEEARYRLLETLRQYAEERLAEAGEVESARQRHAGHYLGLAEAAVSELRGAQQAAWFARLETEHDNLRAALEWYQTEEDDAEEGLRLVRALVSFWIARHLHEGRQWLEKALSRHRGASATTVGRTLNTAGLVAYFQGDYASARAFYETALTYAQEAGDRPTVAFVLGNLGLEAANQGDYKRARAFSEEGLHLAREVGEKALEANTLNTLAEIERLQGGYERAAALYAESLALFREMGSKWYIAIVLSNMGQIALHQADDERASALHAESLALAHELGDRRLIALGLEKLAGVAANKAQPERAARLFGAAEALREVVHAPMETLDRPDYDRALAAARAGLDEADATLFVAAWAAGRALTLEQAIAYALDQTAAQPLAPRRTPSYAAWVAGYPAGLTIREVEVLGLVALGLTDAQVAVRLVISPRTVSTHLTSIYRKLGVTSRADAVRFAVELGLV